MGVKALDTIETLSREIFCHQGASSLRREISPLRFASVEMTRCGAAFWSVDPPENDWMLLIDILISSGGPADMGGKGFGVY